MKPAKACSARRRPATGTSTPGSGVEAAWLLHPCHCTHPCAGRHVAALSSAGWHGRLLLCWQPAPSGVLSSGCLQAHTYSQARGTSRGHPCVFPGHLHGCFSLRVPILSRCVQQLLQSCWQEREWWPAVCCTWTSAQGVGSAGIMRFRPAIHIAFALMGWYATRTPESITTLLVPQGKGGEARSVGESLIHSLSGTCSAGPGSQSCSCKVRS